MLVIMLPPFIHILCGLVTHHRLVHFLRSHVVELLEVGLLLGLLLLLLILLVVRLLGLGLRQVLWVLSCLVMVMCLVMNLILDLLVRSFRVLSLLISFYYVPVYNLMLNSIRALCRLWLIAHHWLVHLLWSHLIKLLELRLFSTLDLYGRLFCFRLREVLLLFRVQLWRLSFLLISMMSLLFILLVWPLRVLPFLVGFNYVLIDYLVLLDKWILGRFRVITHHWLVHFLWPHISEFLQLSLSFILLLLFSFTLA